MLFLSFFLLCRGSAVNADDDRVVALVRLQGDLLLRLHLLAAHLLHLPGEHSLGLGRRVNTVGLFKI